MTTTSKHEVGRRGRKPKPKHVKATFAEDITERLALMISALSAIRFPSTKWRNDPVGFFREVLGVEPWSKQVEVINSIRDSKRVAVKSGHKVSKDLADDTPMLTPSGWTTHGELSPGDTVFAPDGTTTRIVSTTPYTDRSVMRVHFEDGSHIDASGTHSWVVRSRGLRKTRNAHRPPCTLTTRELLDAQRVPNGNDRHGNSRTIANFTVDLSMPIQAPDATLPLAPYLLGAWLGDGGTKQAIFTGIDGIEQRFVDHGYEITKLRHKPSWYVRDILPDLRAAGIINNKHVPDAYKQASEAQRLEVLRGLMDTDGSCTKRGRATFTNTNHRLAKDVAELARSLGQKVRVLERRAKLYGKDCGPCWTVQWASPLPCFSLQRKLARLKTKWRKKANAHRRMSIECVEVLPDPANTQCIEVDHPSHMYLAGRSLIPTHNSHTAAGIALWFYCSFADARVVMTSTTSRQVDTILWRETRMMKARSGLCVECKKRNETLPLTEQIQVPCEHSAVIDGTIGDLARTGLKSVDFREILGFTAKESEAVAGVSGGNLLYLVDEASGIKEEIFEAIQGNRMGGARVVLFSNPTRTNGEFYEAFTSKKKFYACHTISSEETPNYLYGDNDSRAIPGLASREIVDEFKEEWGEDSPLYAVRVKGIFAELEEAKIFSVHKIAASEGAWDDTVGVGRLWIGIDPAGDSGVGDESVWVTRRGNKMLTMFANRGLSPQAHLVHTLGVVSEMSARREVPVVVLDVEGETGNKVYNVFAAYLNPMPNPPFELVAMRSSDKAHRTPVVYDRQRDELAANLLKWINDGGAILEDAKLAKELNSLKWIEQEKTGKVKLIAKRELIKILKRSPDRYDALSMCAWEPDNMTLDTVPRMEVNVGAGAAIRTKGMDPYGGSGGMDPYGGG